MRRLGLEFSRYFAASLIALGCDLSLLLFLAKYMHYMVAATISFLVGAVLHYFLSILLVFRKRSMAHRKAMEGSVFIAAGLLGLIINAAVITLCVEKFASPLALAKLLAAGVSFFAGYAMRKLLLFR